MMAQGSAPLGAGLTSHQDPAIHRDAELHIEAADTPPALGFGLKPRYQWAPRFRRHAPLLLRRARYATTSRPTQIGLKMPSQMNTLPSA